jgi:glycosyltransferase involved in cell wall biosynthesis
MKKVSVILTTYNSENYIQRTIGSIQNQLGAGEKFILELIAVDDCSTDNTPEILKRNNLICISTGKNSGGPNKGRNIGLKAASGDYICIADHDDEWKENKLISLLPHLDSVPVVTSGYTLTDKATGKRTERVCQDKGSFIFYKKNVTFLNKLTKSLRGQNTYLGSIIYTSELKNILFEEKSGMVDFDWILRLFHQNTSIEVCDSLYNRFVDGNNLSLNEAYRKTDFSHSLMFIKEYETLYPKEVKISTRKIHGSMARYYYVMNNMKEARFYFLRSGFNLKTLAYLITTYVGSGYVKKKFNVFG